MPSDPTANAAVPLALAPLSPERLATVQNEKLVEELRKTQVEIEKIEAEVTLLTRPYRTLPFYFTCATTLFSALAAMTAVYGITLQSSFFKQDVDKLKQEKEVIEEKLTQLRKDTTTQQQAADEAAKLLNEAKQTLEKTKLAKREGEDSLAYSAKHTLRTYEYLSRLANADPASADAGKIQFATEQLSAFLDALEQGRHDYGVVVSTLSSESPEVRQFGALILSRLDKSKVPTFAERTAYAENILAALLTEKNIETKRLEIAAVARLGPDAAPPLLARLRSETGERRLNVLRALGEIGREATQPVIDALVNVLKEKDKQLQRQAVLSLGTIGPTAAKAEGSIVPLLPAKLDGLFDDSEAYGLAIEIIVCLRKIGAAKTDTIAKLLPFLDVTDPRSDHRLLNDLRKELLITFGATGRKAAPAAKKTLEVAAEKILHILNTEDNPALLEEAAMTLGRIGSKEIDNLVKSKEPRLTLAALVALTSLESAEERQAHLAILVQSRTENFLTPSAIRSLKSRGKESIPVLSDALKIVKHVFIRENLVNAIGEVGKDSEVALKVLIDALKDPNPYVQVAAIRGLQRAGLDAHKSAKVGLEQLAISARVHDMVSRAAKGAVLAAVGPENAYKGELNKGSLFDDNLEKYYGRYSYRFEKDYIYQIDVKSSEFDAFVYVKKDGKMLAFDDDGGSNLNARLLFDPPQTDTYEVWPTTYARRAVGAYTVEIRKLEKKR